MVLANPEAGEHIFGLVWWNKACFVKGAPFADYSGPVLVADAGLTAHDILKLAGLSAYCFTSLVDPWSLFTNVSDAGKQTHIVNLTDTSPDVYLEACRTDHPKRFKNFRRLESQLRLEEEEIGLRWGRPSSSVTTWSGLVTRPSWRKTIDTLWKRAAGGSDVSH